jgi:Tol biopolymer transport system component
VSFERGTRSVVRGQRDGSGERQLFDNAGFDYDATWSPDGASIVYTSDREAPDCFASRPMAPAASG